MITLRTFKGLSMLKVSFKYVLHNIEINVKTDHKKNSFKDIKYKDLGNSRNLAEGVKEKEKFATKMNMLPLQHRHHPTTNVDIPKVEI